MHNGNCKCGHHWVVKGIVYLAWLAGVLFFWTSWGSSMVWGFDHGYYAWAVVVLSALTLISGYCGCCLPGQGGGIGGKMMSGKMCSHEAGCKCGDCDRCC